MILKYFKDNYWLLLIIALGTFLRFYHLDYQSIWLDEIHTMIEGNPSLPYTEFYDLMLFREQMPHLYYLIVRVNSLIFGHSTFVVRSLSAVFGVLAIYAIYLLTKELSTKKAGYFSALLLSVNTFHIWYSQEARPYILLALLTIVSFYRLVKFIKKTTYKNAIYYAIFTALMISTHFFGLFVLVGQALLILYFVLERPKNKLIDGLLKAVIAGVLTLLLWLPSVPIFLKIAKIKSFWIQPPTSEVYTNLFREFFGFAESSLFILSVLSIYFFITVFATKYNKSDSKNNNLVFSFIIVAVWIFITLLIPFIRTYTDVPMIISRYFISVLPAAILIVSLGFSKIKSSVVQNIIIVVLVTTSLTDLFLVKKYYTKVSKTQYRELTEQVLEKNKVYNAEIFSVWAWHLQYFFSNENMIITEQTFSEVLKKMKERPENIAKFWFVAAHNQPYQLTSEEEEFLNKNFNLVEKIEYYDTWARYYVPKEEQNAYIKVNIAEFEPIKSNNNKNLLLFSNATTTSKKVSLETGNYEVIIRASSLPNPPINGENAHLTVAVNGKAIGSSFISEKGEEKHFSFNLTKQEQVAVSITYNNDIVQGNLDRNLLIDSVFIKKVEK